LGHREKRLVAEDLERRDVAGSGLPVTPFVQRVEAVPGGPPKRTGTLDTLESDRIWTDLVVADFFQLPELLLGPFPPAELFETRFEAIDEIAEVGGVRRRIRELPGSEGAPSPISALVLLAARPVFPSPRSCAMI